MYKSNQLLSFSFKPPYSIKHIAFLLNNLKKTTDFQEHTASQQK